MWKKQKKGSPFWLRNPWGDLIALARFEPWNARIAEQYPKEEIGGE